jgi:hypothetical protein
MDTLLRRLAEYLQANKGTESAAILDELVAALDSGAEFHLLQLYRLRYDAFELALDLLKACRLASYTGEFGNLSKAIACVPARSDMRWTTYFEHPIATTNT